MDSPAPDRVEAALTYSRRGAARPLATTAAPGSPTLYPQGETERRTVAIRDARPLAGDLSLDAHGFVLVRHETGVRDFHDGAERARVYDAEIAELVAALSGAVRVLVFDHTLRHGDEAVQRARGLREPVKVIHNDYTDWSGPERVRDLLPGEAPALLERRFAIIQVWRPMQPVVLRHPLAICDARTIAAGDLIPTERRHPHRIGEIYHLAHNPAHRWHYVPALRHDEAIVFKTYDSATDGRARFTAHAAFDDPATPPDAPPRESIEARALAFFGVR